jgi:hypothetical protein
MPNKGVITFRGDLGNPPNNYSRTMIEGVTDAAALATLVSALETHTLCNVAKTSFNAIVAGTDAAPGASANVDNKGTIFMRDPTNLHLVKVSLPAPVDADFEEISGSLGERYTAAALTAIVTAINTATGNSYTALYGTRTQKS